MQSLLESEGIPTFIRNQFASSVMGEVPFVEVCPQLYVLNEADVCRARQLVLLQQSGPVPGGHWICPVCGTEIEGQFDTCWNCAVEPSIVDSSGVNTP